VPEPRITTRVPLGSRPATGLSSTTRHRAFPAITTQPTSRRRWPRPRSRRTWTKPSFRSSYPDPLDEGGSRFKLEKHGEIRRTACGLGVFLAVCGPGMPVRLTRKPRFSMDAGWRVKPGTIWVSSSVQAEDIATSTRPPSATDDNNSPRRVRIMRLARHIHRDRSRGRSKCSLSLRRQVNN
jgi:hypothetical protein